MVFRVLRFRRTFIPVVGVVRKVPVNPQTERFAIMANDYFLSVLKLGKNGTYTILVSSRV